MALPLGLAQPGFTWFWKVAVTVTFVLILLNLVLLVAVHGRRIRQWVRGKRQRRFQVRVEEILAELDQHASARGPDWLRSQVADFDELERPLAAVALIERMRSTSQEERRQALGLL